MRKRAAGFMLSISPFDKDIKKQLLKAAFKPYPGAVHLRGGHAFSCT